MGINENSCLLPGGIVHFRIFRHTAPQVGPSLEAPKRKVLLSIAQPQQGTEHDTRTFALGRSTLHQPPFEIVLCVNMSISLITEQGTRIALFWI